MLVVGGCSKTKAAAPDTPQNEQEPTVPRFLSKVLLKRERFDDGWMLGCLRGSLAQTAPPSAAHYRAPDRGLIANDSELTHKHTRPYPNTHTHTDGLGRMEIALAQIGEISLISGAQSKLHARRLCVYSDSL